VKYVCIHPGSRGAWRQWPPQYFALLADHCAEKGFDLIVTGTAGEKDITRELIKWIKHPVTDLTGITSLGALGVLIRDSRLLIANCTGVSHIAAALQIPSFIISMDGEPHRWAPLNHHLHHTIDWTRHPPIGEVVLELEKMLAKREEETPHEIKTRLA
jgi:ADP-heptose:LPS heptosyltransferase